MFLLEMVGLPAFPPVCLAACLISLRRFRQQVPPRAAPCALPTRQTGCGRSPTSSCESQAGCIAAGGDIGPSAAAAALRQPHQPCFLALPKLRSVEAEDVVGGIPHVFLVTVAAVEEGEELLLDYGPDFLRHIRRVCAKRMAA